MTFTLPILNQWAWATVNNTALQNLDDRVTDLEATVGSAQWLAALRATIPSTVIEGRALFMYGPSRGVGVTAQRIHYNRLRDRIGSGFWFNGSVSGYLACDASTIMFGARSVSRQGAGVNEWSLSSGACTWANRANQGGILLMWPFGNDAKLDGKTGNNSTSAKAQASAKNALHAMICLARAETRIESAVNATYGITNGSPNVTGIANPYYQGALIQGTGIPANAYIGTMISGGLGGFKLSSSRTSQVDVNATATNAALTTTITPVYTGTWATQVNSDFSGGNMVRTLTNGATSTYVLVLPNSRRVQWVTAAIDDAEYAGTAGAPFGGTGGGSYSITVDGGTAITGTTSNQHRFGQLGLTYTQMAVDLGTLAAGTHTIVITATSTGMLADDGLLVESLTPLTTVLMKEVELPATYYTVAGNGSSYAKTQTYNGFIDTEVAKWPSNEVITIDPVSYGYDKSLHISAADGAYAHFNDAGERLNADGIMTVLNGLASRNGLTWA